MTENSSSPNIYQLVGTQRSYDNSSESGEMYKVMPNFFLQPEQSSTEKNSGSMAETNDLDIERIIQNQSESRTTIMIRNIPNKYN